MKTNLITTALLLSTSAFVQAETKTELEPINVYSTYATPVNQDQTASSVTVLTEKDFAQRNATYVSDVLKTCLLYTSPSPRDLSTSRMPSSA